MPCFLLSLQRQIKIYQSNEENHIIRDADSISFHADKLLER
jgi:hypothetical protein